MKRVVVKLGGSLFDLADWPERLGAWLQTQPPAHWLLVVGCGAWGDELRRWDERWRLGDAFCHRQCARLLTMTAELTERVLASDARLSLPVRSASSLAALRNGDHHDRDDWHPCVIVLDAGSFLLGESLAVADPLPEDWSTTTDSIAAEVAWRWSADELVLVKSCDHPAPGDWRRAADVGAVDREFPRRATRLACVTWVNLRRDAGASNRSVDVR